MDKDYYTDNLINDFSDLFINHLAFSTLYFYRFPEQDKPNADKIIHLWNQTTTATDSITFAIKELINKIDDYDHQRISDGIQLSSLLNVVAILNDGIKNMWDVFGHLGIGTYPFEKDKHIFNGSIVDSKGHYQLANDDDYFQFLTRTFDMRNIKGKLVHSQKYATDFYIAPETPYQAQSNSFSVVLYCDNDRMDEEYGRIIKLNLDDLFLFIGDRYNSIQELAALINKQLTKINNVDNERKFTLNKEESTLSQVKSLYKSAQRYPDTSNYYSEDILLYINFLELWQQPDEQKQFAENDQKYINEYINVLNQKLLPEYRDNLEHFDADQNLQSADLLHLTPKDNKANLKDYVELVQYFNTQLTPNVVIDSISDINKPIDRLIQRDELPQYAKQLSWLALYLLINAIAYHHWFDHKH
ncbi:hypothetical protein ACYATP_08025 [Lactobacillaceae bacterium Melli_B4]